VFPRTRLAPLVAAGAATLLLGACGEPPQPLPTSPPPAELPSGQPSGVAPAVTLPTGGAALPTGLAPTPGYGYPTYGYPGGYQLPTGATTTTTAATTVSPTPTPSHAPKCAGASQPTGAQIVALVKGKPGIPNATLKVDDGPYCASDWSFTRVEVAGKTEDQEDPLFVVAFGAGAQLQFVTAGSDVCNDPVQQSAPAGIRVLACGF
jgi:hypothetical protein